MAWSVKAMPKVFGGTKTQLIHRLTYHKTLGLGKNHFLISIHNINLTDSDFVETFMLTFHKFVPTTDLLQCLVEK